MSKIEVGKTYQTRDGKTVRILATDLKHEYPVVGAILNKYGTEVVACFSDDGRFYNNCAETKFDIIIPPERKSRWINLYCSSGYSSREQANTKADQDRTHVIEIIIEDGKPVDVKIHKEER